MVRHLMQGWYRPGSISLNKTRWCPIVPTWRGRVSRKYYIFQAIWHNSCGTEPRPRTFGMHGSQQLAHLTDPFRKDAKAHAPRRSMHDSNASIPNSLLHKQSSMYRCASACRYTKRYRTVASAPLASLGMLNIAIRMALGVAACWAVKKQLRSSSPLPAAIRMALRAAACWDVRK